MSIAMLSAISIMCVDAALAARPLSEAAPMMLAQASDAPSQEVVPPLQQEEAAASEPVLTVDAERDPLVFDGESDDQIVERFKTYLESIDTLSGVFTQIAPSGAVSEGKFYLRRPGMLRFEYDPPTPLLVVANGGMVYVRDEALETTDSYPLGRTPLKFLLRRKIDLDDDVKVVSVDRGINSVAVTFASEDDETEGEISIIVTAPEMSLRRWIVRDIQNGITVVTLEDVVAGERLANRLFETPDAGGRFLKN